MIQDDVQYKERKQTKHILQVFHLQNGLRERSTIIRVKIFLTSSIDLFGAKSLPNSVISSH